MDPDEPPRFRLAYYHEDGENLIILKLFEMLRNGTEAEKIASGAIAAEIRDLEYFDPKLERPYRFVSQMPVWLREKDTYRYSLYFSVDGSLVGVVHASWWSKPRTQCRNEDWETVEKRMKNWLKMSKEAI